MLEVDYEETVEDLEGVARRLISFCGLDWDPACLAFHETKRPVRTASAAQAVLSAYHSIASNFLRCSENRQVPGADSTSRDKRASRGVELAGRLVPQNRFWEGTRPRRRWAKSLAGHTTRW